MENLNERMRVLYLERDGPPVPGYGPSRQVVAALATASPSTPLRQVFSTKTNRSYSSGSGSGSSATPSDCFDKPRSRRESQSSAGSSTAPTTAPSLAEPLPWHILVATQTHDLPMTMIPYRYNLVCEFIFIGCNVHFHPEDVEAWISHSASHFGPAGPPSKSVCTFCDAPYAVFEADDRDKCWRNRMLHINDHFANNETILRPDFWVLEHMKRNGLISPEDYHMAMGYTERPKLKTRVPFSYQTDAMKRKVERSLEERDDVGKERRQMRKERRRDATLYTDGTL